MREPQDESLCLYCDEKIPARRRKLRGVARDYCRNVCKLAHAEEILTGSPGGQPAPNEKPIRDQTLDEIARGAPQGGSLADLLRWGAETAARAFRGARKNQEQPAEAPRGAESAAPQSPESNARFERVTLLRRLGLPPFATIDQVRSRRRELAKRFHPDMAGGSAQKMSALNKDVGRLEQIMAG